MYERIAELVKSGESFAIATVVRKDGSTPREPSAKMIVFPDGRTEGTIGGGTPERKVIKDGMNAISSGKSFMKSYETPCGGREEVFMEVISSPVKLLICGAGHISLALYRIARILGFRVIVIDEAKETLTKERFHEAEVYCYKLSSSGVKKLVNKDTFAIVATGSHQTDKEAVRSLLSSDVPYIGMIGSKTKVSGIMEKLRKEGISEEKLENIFAPIGLDISAETPEEIAISILAEIIHFLRKGKPSPISLKND